MQVHTTIDGGGRLVIPAEIRRALGLKTGDRVILSLREDGLRVLTVEQAVRQAQAWVRRYVPAERSLVEELLAERREDSALG